MKISSVDVETYVVPAERPFVVTGPQVVREIPHVVVRVRAGDGTEGTGYAFSLTRRAFAPLRAAVAELAEEVAGLDPLRPEAVHARMTQALAWIGPPGVASMAVSCLDMAVWDLAGKALGQPLHRMLGGYRDRAPTYASGGLWRDYTLPELREAAVQSLEDGFRAMKLRMGGEQWAEDEEARLRAVRDAVGPEVELMVDVNQGWTPSQAIRMGRLLEPYRLAWLEDPIDHRNPEGLAQVASALEVPVCAGEYCYGKEPLADLLRAGAVDILMIDLMRVGGITEWRKIAATAEAFGVPVVSHLMPEVSVHLISAVPNGLTVEYMPWSLRLFRETPRLQDGMLAAPDAPGLGLELDEAAVRLFKAA